MTNNSEFIEYLKNILENIDDTVAKGIAKRAIDKGVTALTEKQRYILDEGIADYIMNECPNCGEEIKYEDMAIAIDNGKCSACSYQWNKMEQE